MTLVTLIAAVSENNVIGKDGSIPWRIPEDLRHFKHTTMGYPVIMGRRTFESLSHPLSGRINIVLSRWYGLAYGNNIEVYNDIEEAIEDYSHWSEIFICGGQGVYEAAMPLADVLNITHVHKKFDGDRFFPQIDEKIWEAIQEDAYRFDDKKRLNFTIRKYLRRDR